MIKICALFSGSSGNSIFISNENSKASLSCKKNLVTKKTSTKLLVDAGMSGKRMELAMNSIGETLNEVDGILITHEHIDHMRGVGVIARRHKIPIYLNEQTWFKMSSMGIGDIPEGLIQIIDSTKSFELGDFKVDSFNTPHDAIESIGYRVEYNDKSISVFTDIGEINPNILSKVSGSDAIFIESNYDSKMLWDGTYPYMLKKRIDGLNGHLSNDECAKAIEYLLKKGTTRFILSHLSQENNLPSIALKTATEKLESAGARIGKDLELQVARRSCPSTPWEI